MKNAFWLFSVVFLFFCAETSCSAESQTPVQMRTVEILSKNYEIIGSTIYIFDNEKYIVRVHLFFPEFFRKEILIVSELSGDIRIAALDISRKGAVSLEYLATQNPLVIELEGITPNALVTIEGEKSEDNRVIVGEREFDFVSVYSEGILMKISNTSGYKFILSSRKIFEARSKIELARALLIEIENQKLPVSEFDSEVVQDLIQIADETLAQGAPEQAMAIAENAIKIMVLLDNRLLTFRDMTDGMKIFDDSKSLGFFLQAYEENEDTKDSQNLDETLLHYQKAANNLDSAIEEFRKSVEKSVDETVSEQRTLIAAAMFIEAVLLLAIGYFVFYRIGKTEGKRIAREKQISIRDRIKGKE